MEIDKKRSDELLNDYKAELEKETRELLKAEYEEKIRKLNESLEMRDKEIENYKEEVQNLKTDLDAKEQSIEKLIKMLREKSGDDFRKIGGVVRVDEALAEYAVQLDDLPAILLPENQYGVEMSAKFLDPRSFTRLICSSKKLYSLAQSGRLTAPMKLSIWTDNPETPFFRTPFGDDAVAMMNLAKLNWYRYELEELWVSAFDERRHLPDYEAKLDKLLKWANIRCIDSVTVDYDNLKCRFLQYCKVRRFKAEHITCLQVLDYPNALKIEDIHLWLNYRFVEEETRSDVKLMRFLERSSAKRVYIEDLECPIDFLPIIGLWQSGQRNFEMMELIGVRVDENKYVIQEFMANNNVVHSKMQLENMSRAKVLEMLKKKEPCVVVGSDENFIVGSDQKFIVVRTDLQMLQVDIRYNRDRCIAHMAILV